MHFVQKKQFKDEFQSSELVSKKFSPYSEFSNLLDDAILFFDRVLMGLQYAAATLEADLVEIFDTGVCSPDGAGFSEAKEVAKVKSVAFSSEKSDPATLEFTIFEDNAFEGGLLPRIALEPMSAFETLAGNRIAEPS